MEPWNMEGRKEGVKGARYDFVRAAAPAEREGRGEKKKDLCISKNGRKTSARARSKPHTFGPRTRGSPRSQWQLGRTDGRTDRQVRSGPRPPGHGVSQREVRTQRSLAVRFGGAGVHAVML